MTDFHVYPHFTEFRAFSRNSPVRSFSLWRLGYVNFFCRGQVGYPMLFERTQVCNHRSVLNILDSLLANQIPAKSVVTIACRIEIRKMAEC